MALFQLLNKDGVADEFQFDDGLHFQPGEEGWTEDHVRAEAERRGKGYTWSLIGVPGWHARIEAEQAEAQAKADKEALRQDKVAARLKEADAHAEAQAQAQLREQAIAAAVAAGVRELEDPDAFAREQAVAQINARYDGLVEQVSDEETLAGIEKLRAAALAKLDAAAAPAPAEAAAED